MKDKCHCEWCTHYRPVAIKVRRTLMYRPRLKREFNELIEYLTAQIRVRDEELHDREELKRN